MSEIVRVKTDTNELEQAKDELNNGIAAMVSRKEDMETSVSLLREKFKGSAAEAFFAEAANGLGELEGALSALKVLWQYEDNACGGYETCETIVSGILEEMR